MRIGSLCSGIGGLDLGLEWAGVGETVWQCEREPFCREVLARHWPNAQRFEDMRTLGLTEPPPPIDVLAGGFPCQDLSHAGKREGLAGERSGLWWHFGRLIALLNPRYVVIENVPGLLSDTQPVVPPECDWLGDGPTRPLHGAFGAVLWTLATLGLDAVWDSVPAAAVGAPHQRDRVFIVAYDDSGRGRDGLRLPALARGGLPNTDGCDWSSAIAASRGPWRYVAHPQEQRPSPGPTQSSVGGVADGVPARVDRPWQPWEGATPRLVAERGPNWKPRLKALGNAVVPYCGLVAGRVLMQLESSMQ